MLRDACNADAFPRQRNSPRLSFMTASLLCSFSRVRLRAFALLAALLIATPAALAADDKSEVQIISMDEAVQKELVKLNQTLDANPKLEEELRNNVDRLTETMYRQQNPAIDALLKQQPNLPKALKTERHFFVHRQIARLARAKVTRKDAVELDKFLSANPDITKDLRKNPGQIVNGDFLIAHPALARFFEAHPGLSSVLLKRADKRDGAKEKTAPAKE
jgi:hypothetical protein